MTTSSHTSRDEARQTPDARLTPNHCLFLRMRVKQVIRKAAAAGEDLFQLRQVWSLIFALGTLTFCGICIAACNKTMSRFPGL